jgi:hypothetical protein
MSVLSAIPVAATSSPMNACVADTKEVQTAVDAYFSDAHVYPNGAGPSNTGGTWATSPGQAVDTSALVPIYLQAAPPRDEGFAFSDSNGTVQGFFAGQKKPCAPQTNNRPKSSACETDTKSVQTAVDAFFNDHTVYPNGTGPSNTGGTSPTQPGQAVDLSALVPAYLHSSPPSDETFTFTGADGTIVGRLNGHKTPC